MHSTTESNPISHKWSFKLIGAIHHLDLEIKYCGPKYKNKGLEAVGSCLLLLSTYQFVSDFIKRSISNITLK